MIRSCVNAGDRCAVYILDETRIVVTLGERVVAVAIVGVILVVITSRSAATGANENELPILHVAKIIPGRLRNIPLPRRYIEAEKTLCLRWLN